MIRLAALADIHGNIPALEAVLEDLQSVELHGLIAAGDLINGPQPVETRRRLQQLRRSLHCWMIRGNGENSLLHYASGKGPAYWQTCRQFAFVRWNYRQLDEETLNFISALPEQAVVQVTGAPSIRVVHGSPRDAGEEIFPERNPELLQTALDLIPEAVLVCGHTHKPWIVEQDGRLALNPGAVCGPLNGYVGAQYALLTWDRGGWQAELCQASYDIRMTRIAFSESKLLDECGALARAFLLSIETGKNISKDFLDYAYQLTAEAGYGDCPYVPDEIWDQAAETFEWEKDF